jgi:hypothetical protein
MRKMYSKIFILFEQYNFYRFSNVRNKMERIKLENKESLKTNKFVWTVVINKK